MEINIWLGIGIQIIVGIVIYYFAKTYATKQYSNFSDWKVYQVMGSHYMTYEVMDKIKASPLYTDLLKLVDNSIANCTLPADFENTVREKITEAVMQTITREVNDRKYVKKIANELVDKFDVAPIINNAVKEKMTEVVSTMYGVRNNNQQLPYSPYR